MWNFENDRMRFQWFVLQCFLNAMARHPFALYICMYVCMYVCILVYEKLVCLLSFVLIIIYCDSVPINQDWFMMSDEEDGRWFGINFKFVRCSLYFKAIIFIDYERIIIIITFSTHIWAAVRFVLWSFRRVVTYINLTLHLHHPTSYLNHDHDSKWTNILPKTSELF